MNKSTFIFSLYSKLQEISSRTGTMKKLLEEQDSIDKELKEKSQKFCELLVLFEEICSTKQITTSDNDIDRLLFKINLSRTLTQILLTEHAASNNLSFDDNLAIFDIIRHVSDSRSLKYFQDKLEKRQNNDTTHAT